MFDEIFNVMKCFPKSYITQFGELILSDKGNVYFTAKDCNTQKDIICKLLEWCSRPLAKGEPYRQEKRNKEWRESLLSGYNEYLGTQFTQEDMYWIYDKLGNAVNHELTLKFISSGYDLNLVYPQKGENMENRYLFRAKRIDTGEWVEGYLVQTVESSYIVVPYKHSTILGEGIEIEIAPSTICQCTGYEGIYEKDIFQCDDERYVIEWSDYSLSWEAQAIGNSESISLGEFNPDEINVIGNAIDNPELLEV